MNQEMSKLFKKFREVCEGYDDIAIFSHVRPDGDSIGSSLAVDILLKKMGKNSKIFFKDEVPEVFKFLPESSNVFKIKDFEPHNYEMIIVVDISEVTRTGVDEVLFAGKYIVCVDHHYTNQGFAKLNIINPNKAATCLLLYEIFKDQFPEFIDQNIATCLLAGIISDTGGFKYRNTDSEVFMAVSDLLKYDVNYQNLMNSIYCSYPERKLSLWRKVLGKVNVQEDIIYSTIEENDFIESCARQEDTEGMVNDLLIYKPVHVAFLAMQTGEKEYKVSIRSKGMDVSTVASKFGGGGHKNAAGFNFTGDIQENISRILEFTRNYMEK